jgi:ribosomal protein S17E
MRIFTALAITQGAIVLANTAPFKKLRNVLGNWITPYPNLQTQQDMEKIINNSIDISDLMVSEKIMKIEQRIDHLEDNMTRSLDEMNLRLCDIIVAVENKEIKNETLNTFDS